MLVFAIGVVVAAAPRAGSVGPPPADDLPRVGPVEQGSSRALGAGEVLGFTASPGGPLRMTCTHLDEWMIAEWVAPAES